MNKLFTISLLVLAFGTVQNIGAQSFFGDENEGEDDYMLDEDFSLQNTIDAMNDEEPGLGDYINETMDNDELQEDIQKEGSVNDWLEGL